MSKERLETFTDAILAIIMTILVLDLDQPDSPSLMGLWNLRESYFAYAISFFWLGAMWINLNKLWHNVKKVNNRVLWWSIIMLFFSSLIPYVTNYAGEHFYNAFAQCFYGVIVLLVSLSNMILNYEVGKANKDDKAFYKRNLKFNRWMLLDIVAKILGIILAVTVYPPIAMISIIAAAFIPTLSLLHFHKTPSNKKD